MGLPKKVRNYNIRWKGGKYNPENPEVEWEEDPNGEFGVLQTGMEHKASRMRRMWDGVKSIFTDIHFAYFITRSIPRAKKGH